MFPGSSASDVRAQTPSEGSPPSGTADTVPVHIDPVHHELSLENVWSMCLNVLVWGAWCELSVNVRHVRPSRPRRPQAAVSHAVGAATCCTSILFPGMSYIPG